MRRICAWCGRDLGVKTAQEDLQTETPAADAQEARPATPEPPDDSSVTSTICRTCAEQFAAYRKPVLVVSREWARMYDELVEMFKSQPEIQVVLDRRQPKAEGDEGNEWKGPDRRRRGNPFTLK